MGVSGKWIKALVGLKKSEKSQSSVKDDNVSTISFQCLIFYNLFTLCSFSCLLLSCKVRLEFLMLLKSARILDQCCGSYLVGVWELLRFIFSSLTVILHRTSRLCLEISVFLGWSYCLCIFWILNQIQCCRL